jgi:hypothetical protein
VDDDRQLENARNPSPPPRSRPRLCLLQAREFNTAYPQALVRTTITGPCACFTGMMVIRGANTAHAYGIEIGTAAAVVFFNKQTQSYQSSVLSVLGALPRL